MKKEFLYRLFAMVIAFAFTFTLSSCDDDDNVTPTPTDELVVLEGNITSNQTLDATKQYLLRGKVYVQAPATLTIPAGTIIFGEKTSEGTLVINRGAKIDAKGTSANPIVFTSQAPVGFRNRGDWGGIVILGKAYNSNGGSATIEGISVSAGSENGVYGPAAGDAIDNDNSGFLQYVRIEYAGILLTQDNELNSLTMGSTGSGTVIDHIMVSYANDDAYEWFGGSVNHKYLIAFSTFDDDFDTDRGYNGKVQYGLVVREPAQADVSGARVFESSSNSTNPAPTVGGISRHSSPTFANVTVLGPRLFSLTLDADYRAAVEVNTSSAIKIYNSIFTAFPNAANFATTGSTVSNNVFAANVTQTATGANAPADFTTVNTLATDVTAIFGAFTNKNAASDANNNLYSLTSLPNLPFQVANSPYLTGATNLNANDTFFDNATHYGAFGTSASAGWNYNSGWVNFTPNTTNY